jgi:hypothetical protein
MSSFFAIRVSNAVLLSKIVAKVEINCEWDPSGSCVAIEVSLISF